MKKIILGILGIFVVTAVVAGSAYALFSSQATVSGISVEAGTVGLQVRGMGTSYATNWNTAFAITGLKPGFGVAASLDPTKSLDMYLQNTSSDVDFNVTMKLTTLPSQWGNYLTFGTQVLVQDSDNLANTTGWMSMPQWANGEVTLPGGSIAKGAEKKYYVYIRVPFAYGDNESGYTGGPSAGTLVGNEIVGQMLSGGVFTITGTQTTL